MNCRLILPLNVIILLFILILYYQLIVIFSFNFNRELSLEERETVRNKVIAIYQELETLLKSDDYNEDLRKELRKSNPDYPNVLTKGLRDLQKSAHGLVVSG